MNPFVSEHILAEKPINMLTNMEKTVHVPNHSFTKSPLSNCSTTTSSSSLSYSPSDKRLSLTKAYSCSDTMPTINSSEYCRFITPKEFADLIMAYARKTVPIVDCRSQIDFGIERICSAYNVNCRAKLMAKKLLSKRLEEIEPNLINQLNHSDIIILYDQSTDVHSEEKIRSLPINLVVLAAKKSNKIVYVIQGGLDAVKSQYPHLIECAVEIPRDKFEQDLIPPSPDAIDKENFTMTEILPHIFVGNTHDAQNLERLNQNGITHIINSTPDLPFSWEKKCKYLRIDILDLPSQNIRKYFETAYQFIDEALHTKTNNVLVHCSAGISRSPTIVLAYMIKKYHMKLDDAFQKMRQLRTIVDPNVSFILQLRDWEKKCLETNEDINCSTSNNNTNNSSRSTTGIYCGSTSKTKSETTTATTHSDSAIVVN